METYRIVELLKEIKSMLIGNNNNDKYLSVKDASEYCSCSISTIRRNVKLGRLKASTTLGKTLMKKSDLENWLNT